jgi:hypothetical protein
MPVPDRTSPWVPPNSVMGTERVVQNLLDLVQRDEEEALAWANTGYDGALERFKEHNPAFTINTRWPILTICPSTEAGNYGDDGSLIPTQHELTVEVEDCGPDLSVLVRNIQRRVRAVRAIIWASSVPEMFAGVDPNDFGFEKINFSKVNYSSFKVKGQNTYLQYANFTVVIDMVER